MDFVRIYGEKLIEIIRRILSIQEETICQGGIIIADCLKNDGIVNVFGTGHSRLIAEEAFYRAGGMISVNPLLNEKLYFTKGAIQASFTERNEDIVFEILKENKMESKDVGIVVSNSGINVAPVEMTIQMKKIGMKVISIVSLKQSKSSKSLHKSGKKLYELADVVIDNCGEYGDALISMPGLNFKIGPSSTVSGSFIIHSLFIKAAEEMLKRGEKPLVFPSINIEGVSLDVFKQMFEKYKNRIRYY
ncbi:MAG: sugar isomerase domain-containing protein [Acidobacteriota bacterium]